MKQFVNKTNFVLIMLIVNLSCSLLPIDYRIKIDNSVSLEDPQIKTLVDRVKKYYSYLENKEFGEIYDLLSGRFFEENKKAKPKSEFIDYLKNNTYLGKGKWKFASLEVKSLMISKDKAYVKMEVSFRDFEEKKTYPPKYWYDEWVFEDNEWALYKFFISTRPSDWPKEENITS